MARPSNRTERRAQIVDGLLTVVAAQGYERASVAQIAAAAGLAAGLVHHHFGNKREVLLALVETLEHRLEARYGTAGGQDGLLALIGVWLARGEGSDPRAVAAWVAIGSEAVFLPEVREVFEAALGRLTVRARTLAAEWIASVGSPADPDAVASLVVAAIHGAFLVSVAAPGLNRPGWSAETLEAALTAWIVGPR